MFFLFHNQISSSPVYTSPLYADKKTMKKATKQQKERYAKKVDEILNDWFNISCDNTFMRLRILTATFKLLVNSNGKSKNRLSKT